MESLKINRKVAWIASTILFFVLWYDNYESGLNWFIYGVCISILAINILKKSRLQIRLLLTATILFSSFAVFWHGNNLAIAASVVVFLFVAAYISFEKNGLGDGLLLASVNLILSPFVTLIQLIKRIKNRQINGYSLSMHRFIPVVLLLFFGILYYHASPVFGNFINQLEWPEFAEITFMLVLGSFFATTLFKSITPEFWKRIYNNQNKVMQKMHHDDWIKSWQFALWSLIALLSFVVFFDFYYRFILNTLPEGLTYSSYLHQGFFSLIFSILLASFLSLALLSYPNYRANKSLRNSVIGFICFNILFVLQTGLRNMVYISEYGLTEKRIAVYFYLLLCLTTLLLTLYAVSKDYKPLFLYRNIGWTILVVMVGSAQINWSKTITKYNVTNIPETTKIIDYDYLLSLNNSNLPILLNHKHKMPLSLQQQLDNRLMYYQNYDYGEQQDMRAIVIDKYLLYKALTQYKISE